MSGIVGKNLGRGSGIIKTAPVGADTVAGSNIADDAIDSEHYADGSIDNAHIADDAIDSEHYADGSIDNAHIADDAIDSEHYADGSIDNAHIADDAIDSEHYAAGSIDTAHIADNQITLALMAGGTDGNIISYDASGDPVAIATGNDGQVLTSAGAGAPPVFETLSAGGTTAHGVLAGSAGNMTFGSIPTGTKRIDIIFNALSDDNAQDYKIRIGDAGGIETSGYVCETARAESTTTHALCVDSFYMHSGHSTSYITHGCMSLYLVDPATYTWVSTHVLGQTTTLRAVLGAGSKSLSAELTQLSILPSSGNLDAGKVNVHYWQ